MNPELNPLLCPRCGRSNQCSQAQPDASLSCWCFNVPISAASIAALPPELQGVACLCPQCAQAQPAAEQP